MSEAEMNNIIEEEDEENEENEDYITLVDDNGNEVSFETIGTVEYKERWFAVLIPFDEEDNGVVILEIVPSEDPEYDDFAAVEDDNLLNEVFEKFKKEYNGEYEFE